MSARAFAPDQPPFYEADPDAEFARLRAEDPVHWYEPGGFWCVTRHADVLEVSRRPRLFSSAHGTQIFEIPIRRAGGTLATETAPSIIRMDPPEHNRHRKLVIGSFTPRPIAAMADRVREIARASLEGIEDGEVVDFVERLAVPLPMQVIAEMLGVPLSDQDDFKRWSDAMVEAGGGGVSEETVGTLAELFVYFNQIVEARRKAPRADLVSTLARCEIDGEALDDPEIVMFLMTLLVAGNETTRNLLAGGMRALLERPEQLALLVADPSLLPNAIEEMLRFVTPVRNFARRAMRDCELGGHEIREGDYLVLHYGSANRDEAVFGPDADHFDVTRADAGRHLAFGHGEHLCLGAPLARLEAHVMFEELLARWPRMELAGEIEPLPSILMNSLLRMPVRLLA